MISKIVSTPAHFSKLMITNTVLTTVKSHNDSHLPPFNLNWDAGNNGLQPYDNYILNREIAQIACNKAWDYLHSNLE